MDADTRAAITEAARISGVTVADWLKRVMAERDAAAEQAEPTAGEAPAAAELARSMQVLTSRIAAMDERARAAIPTLPARLDAIEQHIGRLSAPGRGKSERTRLLHETAAMVSDLARQIDNADEQARSMIEGLPSRSAMHSTSEKDPLTEVINDLDRRIAAMQQRVSEEVPAPPPPERLSLDEIQARLNTLLDEPAGRSAAPPPRSRTASRPTAGASAAVEATLRALEERIDEAKNRLDRATAIAETRPPAATIDHIQRIEQRLSDIADRLVAAENDRRKPNKETEIANAVREIAAHQKTLDDRAEAAAVRRDQQAIAAAVAALRTDLATLTDQVSAITRIGKEGHGAVFEVAHRLDTMAAERPFDRNMLESMRDEIERMRSLVEVGARQDALDAHGDGISAQLENLLRTVADRTRLDALGEEVAALRHQLESDDSPRAVQRLEMHVAELGRSIDAALSSRHVAPIVERLESRIEALTDRVASLGDPGAQVDAAIRSIGQHLDVRLTDISERLGGLIETTPQTVDMEAAQQRFEASIAAIANRLGGVVENATRPQTAAIEAVQRQLEERFEDITERLSGISDNAQERAEVQHVYTRLQSVIERIDRLNSSQKERSPALDAIKSEIGALRKEVVAGKVPPSELDAIRREIASLRTQMAGRAPADDNSELEHQVQQLARQLDIVSKSRHTDEPALAALEAQVARLAKELERSKPQTGAMNHVEETLGRLQAALADSRQESIAAARKEARRAVAELSEVAAGSEADSTLIKSLMRDLDDLKNASGGTDMNTEVRLESVSQTMNHVVERLSRLEGTAEAAPPKKEPEAPKRRPGDWKQTFDRVADSVPEPVVERRSEKASVAPEAAPFVQIDFSAAQRRAEFIAAARRAAQAVAEEAARSKTAPETASEPDETEEVAEERQGAFARISQAIRGRRRPLLLAAAAIVLAIGTVQLYGKFAPTIGHSPFLTTARALLSGKSQDRLIANASASVAKPAVSPAIVPAPDTGQASVRQIMDTTAAATATTPSSSMLVPPSSNPPAQVTFASPDTAATHFSSDGPEIQASAAPLPAAPKATPLPIATPSGASVILTSASTATSAADTGIDPAVGSQKLIAAAGAGDANAEFEVATRYAEGANVPADLAKAAVWYAKAAEGGNAIAQYRLASLYERGQGVGKDLVNAVNWYQRAADQGNVNAMHNLAVLLSEGADGSPDRSKALQWFLGAANYGVRDSQYNLGVIYARGIGTAQDLGQSYKWFALAATQGDTDAAARRDEVAKAMSADDLAKARAAVTAWHAKAPLVEANAISKGNWDDDAGGSGLTVADQQGLVAKIQTLLADAGYDPGPADGRMGPKTVDAVRAYQQKVGMPVTGQIDRTLVASLTQPTN